MNFTLKIDPSFSFAKVLRNRLWFIIILSVSANTLPATTVCITCGASYTDWKKSLTLITSISVTGCSDSLRALGFSSRSMMAAQPRCVITFCKFCALQGGRSWLIQIWTIQNHGQMKVLWKSHRLFDLCLVFSIIMHFSELISQAAA